MQELEEVLGIRACPMNWPVGQGQGFKGIYERGRGVMSLFRSTGSHGEDAIESEDIKIDVTDPAMEGLIGDSLHRQLKEEIELLDIAGDAFDREKVMAGELTPMFFGSALTNFGVQNFLDTFVGLAPPPAPRESTHHGRVQADGACFSGFVFKIQANMNPAHRDRIAFLRVCSGHFAQGMSVYHPRLGREIKLADAHQFMAQERKHVTEAYAGDIVGLYDTGIFQIGDCIVNNGPKDLEYDELETFSPEFFAKVTMKVALKRKQLDKGLHHLAQEGAIQVFRPSVAGMVDPIVGAVGQLQFEVLKYRLEHEYGVDAQFTHMAYACARWVRGEGFDPNRFHGRESTSCVFDLKGRAVLLLRNEWALNWIKDDYPKLTFLEYAPRD
jgi:peptide chain release factor 3